MKKDAKMLLYEEWTDWIREIEEPSYRAKQIFEWIHRKKVSDFSQMTNLPSGLISRLDSEFEFRSMKIQKSLVSSKDGTVKYLYLLHDGETVETVFMRYRFGNSICISSEVGCNMGCTFCASTKAGLIRRLTASEMLDQVYQTESDCNDSISHIVIMGIGEPLDNMEELVRFLHLISHPNGRNISLRHITVSTCGLAEKIYQLADFKLPVTLAVSLHASNDALRNKTMPINRRYPIAEILKACYYYFEKTGRRVTFEYACIQGVNDSLAQAKELSRRLHGFPCHVNLIPVNPIEEQTYLPPSTEKIKVFANLLETAHIPVTIRRTLGQDINAACGQLRRAEIKKKEEKEGRIF